MFYLHSKTPKQTIYVNSKIKKNSQKRGKKLRVKLVEAHNLTTETGRHKNKNYDIQEKFNHKIKPIKQTFDSVESNEKVPVLLGLLIREI